MLAERATDWTQAWKQQGRQEGLAEGVQKGLAEGVQKGLAEGVQKGEAALLLRQLDLRFGPLTEADRTRLMEADADTLLRWGERVLTAATLAEVFDR